MDTKLIKQYGEDILSYRLRTSRNKRRMQYEDFHKQLIALNKEEKLLRQQRCNLGWEPLVPPVQKGWKRLFVLRTDVARSKHSEFYAGILAKINTTLWCYRKDFMKKKRVFGRKKYVVREQYLLKPHECHFEKLKFTEAQRAQFHEEWFYEKGRGRFIKRYVFNEPWRFVSKVQPNMIDKIRKIDPQIDARLKEIDTYLEKTGHKYKMYKLLDTNYTWWKRFEEFRYNELNPLKNKPLQKFLDEVQEEMI
jgi:hypothetical protein